MWVKALSAMSLAAICCLARSQYERDQISAERIRIRSDKIRRSRTLVFLSDLHNKEFGPDNSRLIRAIRQARPDAVLMGGDMMVCRGRTGVEVPLKLAHRLVKEYPVYAANGNHESRMELETDVYGDQYRRYRQALERMGVCYLANCSAPLGDDLMIYGLDLEDRFYKKLLCRRTEPMGPGYIRSCIGRPDAARYGILLAHSPIYSRDYAAWGADLALTGHFHGGTIRLPLLGGVMTPQFQFLYPYCAGAFHVNGMEMIVSRGLGTHSINIRLNNKPQLAIVELEPGK